MQLTCWRVYNKRTGETVGRYSSGFWLTVREALYTIGGEDALLTNDHNICTCTINGRQYDVDEIGVEVDDKYDPVLGY